MEILIEKFSKGIYDRGGLPHGLQWEPEKSEREKNFRANHLTRKKQKKTMPIFNLLSEYPIPNIFN